MKKKFIFIAISIFILMGIATPLIVAENFGYNNLKLPSLVADCIGDQVLLANGTCMNSSLFGSALIDSNFTNFTQLLDTPGSYSGEGGKLVAVNSGATALEFIASTLAGLWESVGGFVRLKTPEPLDILGQNIVNVSNVTADYYFGNGSQLTGIATEGDNLGNHIASQNITNVTNIIGNQNDSNYLSFESNGDIGVWL